MKPRGFLRIWAVFFTLLFPLAVQGGQLYVQTSGVRTQGYSTPGAWDPENCYPTLELAALQAALNDSMVLYQESHFLSTPIQVPAYLGDLLDGIQTQPIQVICEPGARLDFSPEQTGSLVERITFRGQGGLADGALFQVQDPLALGPIDFQDCRFYSLQDSSERGGSCLNAGGLGSGQLLSFTSCIFANNTSRGLGGALYIQDGYEVVISDCQFLDNACLAQANGSEGRGGALAVESLNTPSSVTISGSSFMNNVAWGPGGTLYLDDASLTMAQSAMMGSQSGVGGQTSWSAGAGLFLRRQGFHDQPISLDISDCQFQDVIGHLGANPWAGDGGAVLAKGSEGRMVAVSVDNCLFQNNFSAQGAGLYVGRFATGTVNRCRFIANTAYLQGGGAFKGGYSLANEGETAVFNYCLFQDNRAGIDEFGGESLELGRGGAFSTRLYSRAEFFNCTFVDNSAHGPMHEGDAIMLPNEGGEFSNDLRKCELTNCVFYGTVGNSRQVVVRNGALSLVSHCASADQEIQTGGIAQVGQVYLSASPFASDTDLYPALDSPLVDAGLEVGLAQDLDGNPVPFAAGPDIGAFESNDSFVPVPDLRGTLDLKAFPNPFNPRTRISFTLAATETARVEILDIRGRRIARLHDGLLAKGPHTWDFSGLDELGNPLASGQYFVKVNAGKNLSIAKILLLR